MDCVNCSVHFLTLKQIGYDESNVAVTFYHDRTHFELNRKNLYAQFTEDFNIQQGRHFVLHNRIATIPNKMSKLKDQVKELDALLTTQVKLIKVIWLSKGRLVLVTQTGIIVWLLIDQISGDIVKIVIDKSLEKLKLSSKNLCDFQFKISKFSVLLISYSDKSKIDLIKFKKSSQFFDFYSNSSNLEKLENFDPNVATSYEFPCPEVNLEKFFINDESDEFFTLWWQNKIEIMSQKSLLDREDLRNNILVLTTDLGDPNLLEYMYKSEGLLLQVGHIQDNLISIEQIEYINDQKYSVAIYNCLSKNSQKEDFKPVKIKLKMFYIKSKVICTKVKGLFVIILSENSEIVLYDFFKNSIRRLRFSDGPWHNVEWVIENYCFYLSNKNGEVKLLDIGLNELSIKYNTRFYLKFNSISTYLNENLFVPNGSNQMEIFSSSLNNWDSAWSCFKYTKGPLGLFKLSLNLNLNSLDLTNFYLKNYKLSIDYVKKSVNLYESLDWNRIPVECLACLQKNLNILLSDRVNFDNDTCDLCERVLGGFYKPSKQLSGDIILEYKFQVSKYARKFFFILVENFCFEKALRLADDLANKDLYNDLFYAAYDYGARELAEVCRLKFHELKDSEKKEKIKNELNRSVNTVDDNLDLKDNLDCLSLSSSEKTSSIESLYNATLCQKSEKKFKLKNIRSDLENSRPKIFNENDIENFAKMLIKNNEFVYEAAFN